MQKGWQLSILVLALVGAFWLGKESGKESEAAVILKNLKVGQSTIRVEIADNSAAWAKGLSGKESLAEDEGMLFVYPSPQRLSFWMKEMKFPLDMIVVHNLRVIEIHRDIRSPKEGEDGRKIGVKTVAEAEMLLEVNAGWAERHGIKVGDEVQL